MEVGLFDIANPLWELLDAGLWSVLPPGGRVILWGGLAGALSMGLYWLFSSQQKIAGLKSLAKAARQQVLRYDGDFDGLLPLVRNSLSYSLRYLIAVFLPALGASLPLLCLLAWLSTSYGYRFPEPGTELKICTEPASVSLYGLGKTLGDTEDPGCRKLDWPVRGEPMSLQAPAGRPLAILPLPAAIPVVHKKQWWNLLLANPAGYLDADSPVSALHLELPRQELFSAGPGWLRTWEAPFFLSLILISLLLKWLLRIH